MSPRTLMRRLKTEVHMTWGQYLQRARMLRAMEHLARGRPEPHDVVNATLRHRRILLQLFESTGVGGRLTTDTHLAAIAIEHQAELHSNGADFASPRISEKRTNEA